MTGRQREIESLRRHLLPLIEENVAASPSAFCGLSAPDLLDVVLSRYLPWGRHEREHVNAWLAQAYRHSTLRTERRPLTALDHWRINPESGNIEHEGGRFFTVLGTSVRRRDRFDELEWNQPYVDQPEVGILGILAAQIDGILHFCLQAKEEPGNIHSVQLSPTVQATYSNYRRSHGGKSPPFVDLFLNAAPRDILYSRLQTEDGGRFLYKSNRNMIVRCDPDNLPGLDEHSIWLTLRQIVTLLKQDNTINACTRSILSALLHSGTVALHQLRSALTANGISEEFDFALDASLEDPSSRNRGGTSAHLREVLAWLDEQKASTHLHVRQLPLKALRDWHIDSDGFFSHREGRFFRVIGLSVETSGREVARWTQPILENPREGVIGLLVQTIRGSRHALMQAKAEPGNRPPVQIAPTVQFTPANYLDNLHLGKPFLFEEFQQPSQCRVVSVSRQSEEGARFYRERHLHRILELPPDANLEVPPNYYWCSLEALACLQHMGELLNSSARSILTCVL